MGNFKRLQALQGCINFAKDELGESFLSSDIFSKEGLPVVDGYNSNVKASALFANITDYTRNAIDVSNLPNLKDYYFIKLKDNNAVIVILSEEFLWGMLLDLSKTRLGYLFSIFLPEAVKKFKEANKVS